MADEDQAEDQTEAELEKTRRVVREQVLAQAAENEQGPAPAEEADAEVPEGWDAYTVEELKDELRARELPVSGSKDELVSRLDESDREG